MPEIKISFDLTFSRRLLTAAGTLAIMFCAVPELESESVTLSTYYPAPSGVYTNMITTGNTYLARDGFPGVNRIGIGVTNPSVKVEIAQNEALKIGSAYLSSGGDFAHLSTNEYYGYKGSGLGSDSNAWRATTAGALFSINGQTFNFYTHTSAPNLDDPPDHALTMSLDSVGNLTVVGQISRVDTVNPIVSRQGSPDCSTQSHKYGSASGGKFTLCGAGQYITLLDGIYTEVSIIPVVPDAATNPEVTARCCPCPAGGCVL